MAEFRAHNPRMVVRIHPSLPNLLRGNTKGVDIQKFSGIMVTNDEMSLC